MKRAWEIFVDVITLVWLGVFAVSLAGPAAWAPAAAWVSGAIGAVFVVDLVVIFRRSAGWADFLRRAWLDLLLLIPFFRIFRIGRFARLLRINRLSRLVRRHKTISRIFRADVFEVVQEGADLVQKTLERAGRFLIITRK
ncbi:MAG: hypothetical protein K9J79_03765 [Desulfobacteraceae bacterium]|nr:hypothetical protein [Desulfobacteraceae bacterium]